MSQLHPPLSDLNLSLQEAYGQPGWLAALKLPLLFLGFGASHQLYRLLQFLLVLGTT
jgi:hypothetical protein